MWVLRQFEILHYVTLGFKPDGLTTVLTPVNVSFSRKFGWNPIVVTKWTRHHENRQTYAMLFFFDGMMPPGSVVKWNSLVASVDFAATWSVTLQKKTSNSASESAPSNAFFSLAQQRFPPVYRSNTDDLLSDQTLKLRFAKCVFVCLLWCEASTSQIRSAAT